MNSDDLVLNKWYWWTTADCMVKYIGLQSYKGETHHEFWEPAFSLFHWCNLEDIKEITKEAQ